MRRVRETAASAWADMETDIGEAMHEAVAIRSEETMEIELARVAVDARSPPRLHTRLRAAASPTKPNQVINSL